jgi:uncharacterized membrane protein
MRSLLLDIGDGIHNVYNGWILWNLFLAFVPMLISFKLFRPRLSAHPWFAGVCVITGVIGAIGLHSRLPRIMKALSGTWQNLQGGDPGTLMQLLWLAIVVVIALLASLWLYRNFHTSKLSVWWLGLVVFITFLPNAPYVLTDVIHLIRGTSTNSISVWVVAVVFIPLHLCAILVGFEAYVIALINLNYFLKEKRLSYLILPTEWLLHGLSALGIYLGRFIRLNSWDILVDPTSVLGVTLNTLTSKRPVAVIVFTFVVLTVLYWVMKQVTLGLKLRLQYARQGLDVFE